jgi:hypothetical protein
LYSDRRLGEFESGDRERESAFMASDVSNGDGVALRNEVVHVEAGKAFIGQLAFVWLFTVVTLQRCKVMERLRLDSRQVEATKFLIEILSLLLNVMRTVQHWLVHRFIIWIL